MSFRVKQSEIEKSLEIVFEILPVHFDRPHVKGGKEIYNSMYFLGVKKVLDKG